MAKRKQGVQGPEGDRQHVPDDHEEESAGLQVVDVVLWCFKRIFSDKEIGQEAAKLLISFMQRAYQNDFSFEGVGRQVEAELGRIMDADMSKRAACGGA
jgi:hypothetical protein